MDNIFDNAGTVDPTLFGEGQPQVTGTEQNTQEGAEPVKETPEATPEGGQVAQKYAGKFESPDQLEEAYKSLQSEFTKRSMKLSEIEKQLQTQQVAPVQEQPQEYEGVDPWVESTILTPLQQLQSKLTQLEAERLFEKEVNDVTSKYSDFGDYIDDVGKVLQEHPELTNVKGKFEIAYKVAKAQKLEEVAKQAYENGKQDSQKVKELKSQQIIEKSKAIQDTPSPDDEILNGILKSGGKWGAFGI